MNQFPTQVAARLCLEPMELSLPNGTLLGNPSWQIERCQSSNDLMHELAKAGAPQGTLIRAIHQEKGRGRQGAAWFSDPLALQFSLLLRPPEKRADLPFLNVLFAHAILATLYEMLSLPIMLKWPNDLILNGKKLCGVMSESRSHGDLIPYIVLGCGLNLNTTSDALPKELRSLATSIWIETGEKVEAEEFLSQFLQRASLLYGRYFVLES